jgi:excisionase family DNA binding protein
MHVLPEGGTDPVHDPKTARIAEIAVHWAVRDHDTVRKILKAAGIRPASSGPARRRWADIWAFEGAGSVGPAEEAAFHAPLRAPHEVGAFFPGLAVRTLIDHARKKRIPAIRIGKHWRFREITLETWLDHGAGEGSAGFCRKPGAFRQGRRV